MVSDKIFIGRCSPCIEPTQRSKFYENNCEIITCFNNGVIHKLSSQTNQHIFPFIKNRFFVKNSFPLLSYNVSKTKT